MGGSQGDQANLVGMVEHQNILTLASILIQTIQLGVISLCHCLVILRLDGGNAVLYGRNLSCPCHLTHHLELLDLDEDDIESLFEHESIQNSFNNLNANSLVTIQYEIYKNKVNHNHCCLGKC